jgi:hypothetical protein
LKKSSGKSFVLVNCAGTASQLISRRPSLREPGRLALRVPSASRNAFTLGVISPAALNTVACAWGLAALMATRSPAAVAAVLGTVGRLRLQAPTVRTSRTDASTPNFDFMGPS